MTALHFRNVTVRADGRALFAPLTFDVEAGATMCITGPSGSGKSSLLAHACGFLPDALSGEGQVRAGDKDLTACAPEARRLGLLFQDSLLFPHLSVAGNLLFGLTDRASRSARRTRVDDALSTVGLTGFGERDPATLSGGQQARVALLRVLLSRPRALLLDEPFGALDADSREQVRALVFAQAREHRLPVVLVTHDEQDVAAAGGRRIELERAG